MSMNFRKMLKANRGNLLMLRSDLYWFGAGWDRSDEPRPFVLLDTCPERRGSGVDALTNFCPAEEDPERTIISALINGRVCLIRVSPDDVEIDR